jgi:hypothetical protein
MTRRIMLENYMAHVPTVIEPAEQHTQITDPSLSLRF